MHPQPGGIGQRPTPMIDRGLLAGSEHRGEGPAAHVIDGGVGDPVTLHLGQHRRLHIGAVEFAEHEREIRCGAVIGDFIPLTKLRRRGATTVVVSRGGEPAIAATGERVVRIVPPELREVDHRGAGDSMSGAMVAARLGGLDPVDALRFGAAAGAGNVTRHGLGSGDRDLVERLAELVELEDLA